MDLFMVSILHLNTMDQTSWKINSSRRRGAGRSFRSTRVREQQRSNASTELNKPPDESVRLRAPVMSRPDIMDCSLPLPK